MPLQMDHLDFKINLTKIIYSTANIIFNQIMKGLKRYLNKYGFVSADLADIPLSSFEYLFDALFTEIEAKQSLLFDPTLHRSQKIANILQVLGEAYESPTLFLILKRLATLFMLARKYSIKGNADPVLLTFLQENVRRVMEEDAKELLESREKKPGSLERMYRYIRELSGSREKAGSKTKMEVSSQRGVKGGLKETFTKAILPFCAYLLRVLQDGEAYTQALRGAPLRGEARWRVINWGLQLGQIVQQLSRLSHYLSKDFHSIHVFMVLLCCRDLAIFYDLIKESIRAEAVELGGKEVVMQGMEGMRMLQLKKGLEQLQKIKERLNLVFGNRVLQNELCFFAKPTSYKVFEEEYPQELEWVVAFGEKTVRSSKGKPRDHCKTTADQRQGGEEQAEYVQERNNEVQEAIASRLESRKVSLKALEMRRGRKMQLID